MLHLSNVLTYLRSAILYQDACEQEHPIINLGAIESTVRGQIQAYVTPAIGEFFVKPSAAPTRDMSER